MFNIRTNRRYLICGLVILAGFGFALTMPWLANSQGLAANQNAPGAANSPPQEGYSPPQEGNSPPQEGNSPPQEGYSPPQEGNSPPQEGYSPPQVGISAPTVGPCYATHNNGTTVFDSIDASAVQQAVDAASQGDVVKVAGTCVGVQPRGGLTQTVYISKSLTLQGGYDPGDWDAYPSPSTLTTTLDADRQGRVAVISGTIKTALDGLYLTGGLADVAGLGAIGGGIWLSAEITVTNSIFYSNTASQYGGGIFIYENLSPWFRHVTFSGNQANYGGGYFAYENSSPILSGVNFSENKAVYGGGIFHNGGTPVLKDVSLINNMATFGGGLFDNTDTKSKLTNSAFIGNSAQFGGGIFNNNQTDSQYVNVLLSGNASQYGGGMFNNSEAKSTLTNASLSGNSASLDGGGIFNNPDSDLYIYNSILWNNLAGGVTGTITSTVKNLTGAVLTATHSLLHNAGASGGGIWVLDPSFVDGGDNIDQDPMFITPVDPSAAPSTAGNLRLLTDSPAIDAGDNSFITYPLDLDNLWRFRDGDGNMMKVVDMGAYEYPSDVPYTIYQPLIIK